MCGCHTVQSGNVSITPEDPRPAALVFRTFGETIWEVLTEPLCRSEARTSSPGRALEVRAMGWASRRPRGDRPRWPGNEQSLPLPGQRLTASVANDEVWAPGLSSGDESLGEPEPPAAAFSDRHVMSPTPVWAEGPLTGRDRPVGASRTVGSARREGDGPPHGGWRREAFAGPVGVVSRARGVLQSLLSPLPHPAASAPEAAFSSPAPTAATLHGRVNAEADGGQAAFRLTAGFKRSAKRRAPERLCRSGFRLLISAPVGISQLGVGAPSRTIC